MLNLFAHRKLVGLHAEQVHGRNAPTEKVACNVVIIIPEA
jgi:hypothetical protein